MRSKDLKKERAIEKRLAERFALTHVHVQAFCRPGEKNQLVQIDFTGVVARMTVAGLRRLCDDALSFGQQTQSEGRK